jgi:hypothetical protein
VGCREGQRLAYPDMSATSRTPTLDVDIIARNGTRQRSSDFPQSDCFALRIMGFGSAGQRLVSVGQSFGSTGPSFGASTYLCPQNIHSLCRQAT